MSQDKSSIPPKSYSSKRSVSRNKKPEYPLMSDDMQAHFGDLPLLLDGLVHYYKKEPSARPLRADAATPDVSLFSDRLQLMLSIKSGIPYSTFASVQELTPLTQAEWAEFLSLSTKSLSRYQQTGRSFRPIYAEKIIELAEVMVFGLDVFGSKANLHLWMVTPCFALGNAKPIDLARNSYGKEMVIEELGRIAYGILG